MIKFSLYVPQTNRKVLGFCLTKENIEKLTHGQPIHINGEMLHMPAVDFVIMYGDTAEDIIKELESVGFDRKDMKVESRQ